MQHLKEEYGIEQPWVHVERDVAGRPFPKTVEEFHKYPEQNGWRIDHDTYELSPCRKDEKPRKLCQFVQEWLFFGLVFTVVQTNKKPACTYEDLVDASSKDPRIDTTCLPRKLREWEDWEMDQRDHRQGQRLRMIRLGGVLRLARRVVQRNLGWSPDHAYRYRYGDRLYVSDEVILSIMTLGEALHEAKMMIARCTDVDMRGWSDEDDSGWGPPRWVIEKMKNNWCPRAVHLLRGQLRSNATYLLAAFHTAPSPESHRDNTDPHNPARHDLCSPAVCKVTPEDKDGRYQPKHRKRHCKNVEGAPQRCGKDHSAKVFQGVIDVLQKDQRPLLRFKDDKDGEPSYEIEVIPWEEENPIEYAAISHVWSDGFGNEQENNMFDCQVEFIRRQLERLRNTTKTTETAALLPFWIDTLTIPKGQNDNIKHLRMRSLQQIHEVFAKSAHTIVLDLGLTNMDPDTNKPVETAMRIIGSNWMRRLWTLQEAYVSKNLYVAFQHSGQELLGFDDLYRQFENPVKGPKSPLAKEVKKQLETHIMGEERATNSNLSPESLQGKSHKEASVLVVNAWKAVRWRVST